jgi:hypothetical protein
VKDTENKLHKFFELNHKPLAEALNAGKWKDEEITQMKDVLKTFSEQNNIQI